MLKGFFLSSFAPSSVIQDGKLVISDTISGPTATEMWTSAIETCYFNECSSFGLVRGNKLSINLLTKTITTELISHADTIGMAIMIDKFATNIVVMPVANYFNTMISFIKKNTELMNQNAELLEQTTSEAQVIPLLIQLGFQDVNLIESLSPNYSYNIKKLKELMVAEMTTYNLATIEETNTYKNLLTRINLQGLNLGFFNLSSSLERKASTSRFWGPGKPKTGAIIHQNPDGTCYRYMEVKHYAFWISWRTTREQSLTGGDLKVPAECE